MYGVTGWRTQGRRARSLQNRKRMRRCERPSRSLPLPCALDNCDVTINREFGDTLDLATGLGPVYLQPVEFRPFSNAQHHTWIMGRQKTASADLHPLLLQISGLIRDPGSNGVGIRFCPNKIDSEPMVLTSSSVA